MSESWNIDQAKGYIKAGNHTFSVRHFLGGAIEEVVRLRKEVTQLRNKRDEAEKEIASLEEARRHETEERCKRLGRGPEY